jgi:large subunit ribosomal protein L30
MAKEKNLKLTLVRSIAKKLPGHKLTVAALGLRRMHHSVQVKDNAATRGMIQQIAYLLKVEEVK